MSRIQPYRGLLEFDYQPAVGGTVFTFYWLGRGTGAGYGIDVNNFGGPIRVVGLKTKVQVLTAQSGKTVSTYISNTASPASSNSPTHQSDLSMASTGWVTDEDTSESTYDVNTQIWVQTELPAGSYVFQFLQVFVAWEPA